MIGALAAVPLPDARDDESPSLQDALFDEAKIEVPIIPWPAHPHRLVRISAQLYNRSTEYAQLAGELRHRLCARSALP
jgi:isopenicillin-N epimerase